MYAKQHTHHNGPAIEFEPYSQRIEELQLIIELLSCGIKDDLFSGENRHRHVAALNRITEKI